MVKRLNIDILEEWRKKAIERGDIATAKRLSKIIAMQMLHHQNEGKKSIVEKLRERIKNKIEVMQSGE